MIHKIRLAMIALLFFCVQVVSATKLTVVTENWRPYNYAENGEVKGLATDIVKKVLDNTNIEYHIEVLPWTRAYQLAQTEKNYLIFTIIRIPPREKLFKWVRPLGTGGTTSLYRLKTNDMVAANNLEDSKKYIVVTNKNSMDHIWLVDNGFTRLEIALNVPRVIKMFFGGRADLIAFDATTMEQEFNSLGYNAADAIKVIELFKTPPFMALSPSTSDEVLTTLQEAYDKLKENQEIKLVN